MQIFYFSSNSNTFNLNMQIFNKNEINPLYSRNTFYKIFIKMKKIFLKRIIENLQQNKKKVEVRLH